MQDPSFFPKVTPTIYSTPSNPMPPDGATKSLGIFSSDVVIRTALISAFAEMRANPWLLDYAFCYLPQDGLTADEYGVAQKDQAKKWFLETDIAVHMNYNFSTSSKFPAISLTLMESSQDATTLGDVNYETTDLVQGEQLQSIIGPLSSATYNSTTGQITLNNTNNIILTTNMLLLDLSSNINYTINTINDYNNIVINSNIQNLNLNKSYIVPKDQFYRVALESVAVRDTYRLGCHVTGKPIYLIYLYNVLIFAILWGKQKYLEARGFERSSFVSSDFAREAEIGNEVIFSRYTNLTGYIRHFWPKSALPGIQGFGGVNLEVIGGGVSPSSVDLSQGWEMDGDKPAF